MQDLSWVGSYRIIVLAFLMWIAYFVYDLSLNWAADNQTQRQLRIRIEEVERENQQLYTEMTKLVDERESLKEENYKMSLQIKYNQRDRSF